MFTVFSANCLLTTANYFSADNSPHLRYAYSMKLSTLETVFDALNQANVKYLVAGGIAVNIQ